MWPEQTCKPGLLLPSSPRNRAAAAPNSHRKGPRSQKRNQNQLPKLTHVCAVVGHPIPLEASLCKVPATRPASTEWVGDNSARWAAEISVCRPEPISTLLSSMHCPRGVAPRPTHPQPPPQPKQREARLASKTLAVAGHSSPRHPRKHALTCVSGSPCRCAALRTGQQVPADR